MAGAAANEEGARQAATSIVLANPPGPAVAHVQRCWRARPKPDTGRRAARSTPIVVAHFRSARALRAAMHTAQQLITHRQRVRASTPRRRPPTTNTIRRARTRAALAPAPHKGVRFQAMSRRTSWRTRANCDRRAAVVRRRSEGWPTRSGRLAQRWRDGRCPIDGTHHGGALVTDHDRRPFDRLFAGRKL
jgi:hypothetical protein